MLAAIERPGGMAIVRAAPVRSSVAPITKKGRRSGASSSTLSDRRGQSRLFVRSYFHRIARVKPVGERVPRFRTASRMSLVASMQRR
jgi:hypothetical protein